MSMTFSGKVALVTGGAAGIGRATALAFAAEGLQVVVSDVDVAGGEGTVQLIRDAGGEAVFVRCDVTREAEVKVLMERTLGAYGRLDYAFNNAGIEIEKGRLAEGSEAEFDAIMGVNVKGVWLCMKHQLPLLLAQGGGAIVNTASVAGIGAAPKPAISPRCLICWWMNSMTSPMLRTIFHKARWARTPCPRASAICSARPWPRWCCACASLPAI